VVVSGARDDGASSAAIPAALLRVWLDKRLPDGRALELQQAVFSAITGEEVRLAVSCTGSS
jgi:hypothetical protein